MRRSLLSILAGVVLPVATLSAPAVAKHPVKEIPVHAFLFNVVNEPLPWNSTREAKFLHTTDLRIEFANRVYATANIKLTFDATNDVYYWNGTEFWETSNSVTIITDQQGGDSTGCWSGRAPDQSWNFGPFQDDIVARALVRDPDVVGAISLIMPRYTTTAEFDGTHWVDDSTRPCPHQCTDKFDCSKWVLVSPDPPYARTYSSDPKTLWACDTVPNQANPHYGDKVCKPNASFGSPPDCFEATAGGGCRTTSQCNGNPSGFVWTYPNMFTNQCRLTTLAHELGHYLGLQHPKLAYEARCYDEGQHESGDCADQDPNSNNYPACAGPGQTGPGYDCANPAWKNIMSYYGYLGECPVAHAGETNWFGTPEEKWNSSLTPDQIALIHHTQRVFYDKAVVTSNQQDDFHNGGYERLLLAGPSDTTYATGYDSYNTVAIGPNSLGTSSWKKGDIEIQRGDFNGDGVQDAVVIDPTGVNVWLGSVVNTCSPWYPWWCWDELRLTHQKTLSSVGIHAWLRPYVVVGNFMGDHSDDVLVATSSGIQQWEGHIDGEPTLGTTVLSVTWSSPWNVPTLAGGNFVGKFDDYASLLPNKPPRWVSGLEWGGGTLLRTVFDYDDLAVRFPYGSLRIYEAEPTGSGLHDADYVDSPANSFTGQWTRMWAGNIMDDYHDELLIQTSGQGLQMIRGQSTSRTSPASFDFSKTYAGSSDWSQLTSSPAKAWLGNFTSWVLDSYHDLDNWGYGDILLSTPTGSPSSLVGSTLWQGYWQFVFTTGQFRRTDLTTDVTHAAVADFIRAGYDDLMFFGTYGSYLYAGDHNGALTPNVWMNGTYNSNSYEWFGRK